MKNSTRLDSNALAQLGTPAARRKRGKSGHPIWISIGPQKLGAKLGYRAAEAGAWLAALTFEGERLEATIGPADDENAPPEALNIWDAAIAAVAWAESERARTAVGSRAVATPDTAADLTAELDAARAARAVAEARAGQFETERDSAAAASESLRTLAARLIGERAYLAGQLTRIQKRPWKPIKLAGCSVRRAGRSRRECPRGSRAPPRSAARIASIDSSARQALRRQSASRSDQS